MLLSCGISEKILVAYRAFFGLGAGITLLMIASD